jgi:replicative DNA helicase
MIEKQVISGLLLCKDQLDVYSEIKPEYFTNIRLREIFIQCGSVLLGSKKLDIITLHEQCNENLKDYNVAELTNLQSEVSSAANLKSHVLLLKEKHYKRELEKTIEQYHEEIKSGSNTDDIDKLKNDLIADLSSLDFTSRSEFISIKEHTEHIDKNLMSDKTIEGHSWGLKDLDLMTSGIVKPRMYVIGGLKKGGKTRFLMHLRKALYFQGIPSPFLSLEMPAYEITKLTYSTFCGIEDTKFRSISYMSSEEKHRYNGFKKEIDENLLPTECISGLDISQVLQRMKRYSKLYPNGVILIDYLQRISHDENRQAQELEGISKKIADSCRANNVSVVVLSQLNNSAEHVQPTTGHLKGSGGIGEASDSIILLDNVYRRTKEERDKGLIQFILEQRYNDSGIVKAYANLGWCEFRDYTPMQLQNEVF